METVTIPKKEYEALKKTAGIDWEVIQKAKRSFEDVKHGRVTVWKNKSSKK